MRFFLKRSMAKRYFRSLSWHVSSLLILVLLFASIGSIGTSIFLSPALAEAQGSEKGILHRHHPLVQEAIRVKHRHLDWLMRIPGVVGAGVGIESDGLPVITVFASTPGVAGIPEWLESTPVQVEVTGMIVALTDPTARFSRPVPIGVSTGHPDITAGTIGCRVTDGTNVYALSNNHVYANANNAEIGDSALQPGPFDGGTYPADKIGELHDFEPINFSVFGSNMIDAAIASTTPDMLGYETLEDGYGAPSSQVTAASFGLRVKKYGRTTGMTHGKVSELDADIIVCYANCSNPFFAKLAWFNDQIGIITKDTVPFSLGGDSGSLIVTENGNNPVGLLFAGSDTTTFANRIDIVLQAFGVTIDDGAGTPAPPPPPWPAAPTNLVATAVSSTQIDLTWTDNATNEDGFKIERCQGATCTKFKQIATLGADATSYLNSGLRRNTTYSYRVRAYNSAGNSAYSNTASARTSR